MRAATETRNETYRDIKDFLAPSRAAVFLVIKTYPGCCDYEIAKFLNRPINQITGRRNELCEMGIIEKAGTKLNPVTVRNVAAWRLTTIANDKGEGQ